MKKILVYTVHKAASMFLHELCSEISNTLGVTHYSINNDQDFVPISQNSWMSYISMKDSLGIFGPIRAFEAQPNVPNDSDLVDYSIILHLRDPRDVLTSLFYSEVYSHPKVPGSFNPSNDEVTQWKTEGIDKYVMDRAMFIKVRYEELCSRLLGRDNCIFVKYETMVEDYSHWLVEFLSGFNRLISSTNEFQSIYRVLYEGHRNDFSVASENVYRHKRQVIPGDHKRKLMKTTISDLTTLFQSLLVQLGYSLE